MSMAAVFLDIEKAFDKKKWHLGLLYKWPKLQFSISVIKLISSFTSRRKFWVSVEGRRMSTPSNIQAGLLEGSVLSLTLYSIYI
jgi:hypothetical protein